MNTTPSITDAELLEKLKGSFINLNQKKELESLIPEMTGDERGQLLALIEQSREEAVKDNPEYQEAVKKLNTEYEEKLKTLEKTSAKEALTIAETSENEKSAKELKRMDSEIAEVSEVSRSKLAANLHPNFRQSHVIRNLVLIFLLLILAAGTALYVISAYGLM